VQRPEVGAREARRDRLGWSRACRDGRGGHGDEAHAIGRDEAALRRDPIGVEAEVGDVDRIRLGPEMRQRTFCAYSTVVRLKRW